jgi:hypothetical protein
MSFRVGASNVTLQPVGFRLVFWVLSCIFFFQHNKLEMPPAASDQLYDPRVCLFSFSVCCFLTVHSSQEKVGRCFIEMYSASEYVFTNFSIPLVRGRVGSEYKIKILTVSFKEGEKAEMYLHIEQCMRKQVQDRLEQLGAKHVIIHTFPRGDRNSLALRQLCRVLVRGSGPGMKSYTRGGNSTLMSALGFAEMAYLHKNHGFRFD